MTANPRRPGKTSRRISRRLAARSVARFDRPVTLPPGRARELTSPLFSRHREDGWNDRCGPLCRERWFGAICETQVDLPPDKLGREVGIALGASLAPAVLDRDGATIDPAEFAQPLHKCVDPCALAYWPAAAEVPD